MNATVRTPEPARTAFLFPSVGATQVDRLLTYETQLAPGEVREPWQWHTPPSLARTLLVDEEPLVLERTAFSLLIRKLLPGDASPAEVQEWADLVARLREVYPREIPREVRERARQHASGDDLLEARLQEVLRLYDEVQNLLKDSGWVDLPELFFRVTRRLREGAITLPFERLEIFGFEGMQSPVVRTFLQTLREAFPTKISVHTPDAEKPPRIRIFRFMDDREEVAALVHELHAHPPERPHRVLVGLVEFGKDYPTVENGLNAAGIPFRRLGGRILRHYPAFQSLHQLLRLLEDRDATWLEVYGVLLDPSFSLLSPDERTRLIGARPGEDAPLAHEPVNENPWEAWFQKHGFTKKLKEAWPVLRRMARWQDNDPRARLSDWVAWIREGLRVLGWMEAPSEPGERDLRERVERMLLELAFLDEILDLPEMPLPEFRRWLEELAKGYSIPDEHDPETAGGIWVGRFPDHVPRFLDRLYVLGVTDRAYPRLPSDLILPYTLQEDLGLPSPSAYYQQEKERFSLAFRNVREGGWISVPERKQDTWMAPAPFLLEWAEGELSRYPGPVQRYVREVPRPGVLLPDVRDEGENLRGEALKAWRQKLQEEGLSVTGVARAATCAYRFYLDRVKKIPAWWTPRWQPEPVDIGELAHTFLQKIFQAFLDQSVRTPKPEDVARRFLEKAEKIPDQRLGSAYMADLVRRRLSTMAVVIQRQEESLRNREIFHTLAVETPRDTLLEVDGLKIPLRGRLDRVLRSSDDLLWILDYKTGTRKDHIATRDGYKEREYRLQAAGYALLYPGARGVLFSFLTVGMETDPLVEVGITPELLREFKDVVHHLVQGVFPPTEEARVCMSCAYRTFCPFVREGTP